VIVVKIYLPLEEIATRSSQNTAGPWWMILNERLKAAETNAWPLLEQMLDVRNADWRDYHWQRERVREDGPIERVFCQIRSMAPDIEPDDQVDATTLMIENLRELKQGPT